MSSQVVTQIALMTAVVYVYDQEHKPLSARVLLDSGSEANFMTVDLANKLGIPQRKVKQSISGIQGSTTESLGKVATFVKSKHMDYGRNVEFFVLPKITKNVPNKTYSTEKWNIPSNIPLADPNFNSPGKIDLLMGAELFMELLLTGKFKLKGNLPWMQETYFGWVISGAFVLKKDNHQLCPVMLSPMKICKVNWKSFGMLKKMFSKLSLIKDCQRKSFVKSNSKTLSSEMKVEDMWSPCR
jgi:hypothetical protein